MPSNNNDPSELYRAAVENAARESGVDPDLVMRIIQQESAGDPHATGRLTTSGEHAQGLMQLMPQTQKTYGVTDPFDVGQNVGAGTKLLKELLDKYHGDQRLALVDYNGGPDAVAAYNAGKPFKETAGYLKGIMGDAVRPAPFDLESFINHANGEAPAEKPFDLEGLVKSANASTPSWTDNALASLKNVATGLKDAAIETNPITPIIDAAKGFGKGALETSVDLGQLAHRIPGVSSVTGLTPEDFNREDVRKPLEATNTAQKVGKVVERGAEFALPAGVADAAAMAAVKGPLLRLIPRMVAQAGVGATEAGLHGENPVTGGAIAATGPVIGEIASALAPTIKAAARGMVRTSLKPTYQLLSKMGGFEGAAPHADEIVDFVIKHNLASPEDAEGFIRELERQKIIPMTAAATRRGVKVPGAVLKVTQAIKDFGTAPSLAPKAVESAAANTLNDVEQGALYKDVVTPGAPVPVTSPIVGPNGQPVITMQPGPNVVTRAPNLDINPDELLTAARNTKFTPTTVGSKLSPQDEINNRVVATARGELKDAVPELQAPFEEQRLGINTKKALDRYDVREGNNDNFTLKTAIGVAGGPAGHAMGLGTAVLKLVGGVKSGLLAHQLGDALARQDVRGVTSVIRMMGYGAMLDALPKQEAQP